MTLEKAGKSPTIIEFEDLDFEVEKEGWNRYIISDGSLFKARLIMVAAQRQVMIGPRPEKDWEHKLDFVDLYSVISPDRLKGPYTPDWSSHPTPEQLAAVRQTEMEFTSEAEPWNVYRFMDGTGVRVKMSVYRMVKIESKFDPGNNQVYWSKWGRTVVPMEKGEK